MLWRMAMKKLKRTIMRTLMPVLLILVCARYVYGTSDGGTTNTNNTDQTQILNAYGPGYSNAVTGDSLSIGLGGNASSTGGNADADAEDMKQLKQVLKTLPYNNPVNIIGGIFNGVRAAFGGPNYFHRGRGFEISNALIRERRPEGKPILIFIDSNISRELLHSSGYAYVGRVSLEGDVDRNWDQVYGAAVAEAIPWDVDILLISGGMKGVTVGSNLSFPGAAGAYS